MGAAVEENFSDYANIKNIEFIHRRFFSAQQENMNREAIMDVKNACFQELSSQVDCLIRKLYELFVAFRQKCANLKKFEETMIKLDSVFTE